MVQLYYLVPGCVISMFKVLFVNWSTLLVWSAELAPERSQCTFAFKVEWCNHT